MRTSHKLVGQEIRRDLVLDENIEKALGHFAILRQARENLNNLDGRHPSMVREELRLAMLPFTTIYGERDPIFGPAPAPQESKTSPEN